MAATDSVSLVHDVAKFVAKLVIAGGGMAAIVWLVLTKFGDRWLEHQFAKRLETFKREETEELEHLRHKITSLFSRISKIHEKEFEILPAAFLNLHKAYGACFELVSALQGFPALSQMGDLQFAEFVAACRLPEFRKNELLHATDRDGYYRRWIFWTDLAFAKHLQSEFHNHLVMNRIFMTDDLRAQFGEIDRLISSSLTALEIDREAPGSGLLERSREDFKKIEPLLAPIEAEIQNRLHYGEA
jgi:hypothetical protein